MPLRLGPLPEAQASLAPLSTDEKWDTQGDGITRPTPHGFRMVGLRLVPGSQILHAAAMSLLNIPHGQHTGAGVPETLTRVVPEPSFC